MKTCVKSVVMDSIIGCLQDLNQGGNSTNSNYYHAAQPDDEPVFEFFETFVEILPGNQLFFYQLGDYIGLCLSLFLCKSSGLELFNVFMSIKRYGMMHNRFSLQINQENF